MRCGMPPGQGKVWPNMIFKNDPLHQNSQEFDFIIKYIESNVYIDSVIKTLMTKFVILLPWYNHG